MRATRHQGIPPLEQIVFHDITTMRRPGVLVLAFLLFAFSAYAETAITKESVVDEMNRYRAEHNLPNLHENQRLDAAAEDRMQDMEDLGYWSHDAPDGRAPFVWLSHEGYDYQFAGENLARGFETTEVMVSAWMDSPGHRSNILGVEYSDVGIAIIDGNTTERAYGKSVVVLFAHPKFTWLSATVKK